MACEIAGRAFDFRSIDRGSVVRRPLRRGRTRAACAGMRDARQCFETASSRGIRGEHMDRKTRDRARYELRFASWSDPGRALAFPCDAAGRVDMDALGSRALADYLYARTVVGREFRRPSVRACVTDVQSAESAPWHPHAKQHCAHAVEP
jgi:hypothetical protein